MPLISLTKKQSADRCFLQQLDRARIGSTAPPVFALIFPRRDETLPPPPPPTPQSSDRKCC